MCSQFQVKLPLHVVEASFNQLAIPLRFPQGRPNFEPRDQVTIGDTASVVTGDGDGADLVSLPFAWKGPGGRPIFNFRSEGRRFDGVTRCLVPVSGFYEFTDPQPGQKRKTRWLFTPASGDWFWLAGIVRDNAFALLTTEPGPDIRPYHSRQVVILSPERGVDWLNLTRPEAHLFGTLPAGSLRVERDFPPPEAGLL